MIDGKPFVTLDEAAEYIGIKRATIYNYMKDLGIGTRKFGRDRKAYIAVADLKRLKEYKENPWSNEKGTSGEIQEAA